MRKSPKWNIIYEISNDFYFNGIDYVYQQKKLVKIDHWND